MSLELTSQLVTIGAGVATILGVVWAGTKLVSKKRSQRQFVDNGSIAIQSGRDTQIDRPSPKANAKGRK